MQTIKLYRYNRPDGGVTVSPVMPDCEYTEMFRLVADEGYALTNGEVYTSCVDTEDPTAWSEIHDDTDGSSTTTSPPTALPGGIHWMPWAST